FWFFFFFFFLQKVWLDKGIGKACVLISSNGLAITGIDDRRYWSWISTEESRFRSVAYLQQIWWFEVDGEVEFPFPCGTYTLYFRLQLGRSGRRFGRRVCNSDHVHGWDIKPVKFQLSTSDGYGSKHFLCNGRDWKPGITWTLLLDNGADVSSEAEKQRVIMCLKAAVERRAPEGVRLGLFKPDKPGLLAQVTRTFRENAMNVAQAEISTTMGNHSSVSKSTWTSNISSEDMLTEVLSYFTQPSIPEKTECIWSSQEPTYRVSINTQPHSSILPFIMQPVTEYRKTPANMKKTTVVANCSESLATLEEILHHGRENKKHTVLIQMVLWVTLQVKDKKLLRGTSTTWPCISGRRFGELLNKTGSFMNSFKFFSCNVCF
ncbi:uncharacterized protein LOC110864833, partial [Helianthus annuus]|uniref:uncharacterized protein LOC110864833 n=1 Tax=Helianthus annuus TaxID=4232 RepID=UPI00165307E5